MAWIEQRRRADGGVTARVFWRPSGCRDAPRDWETSSAGRAAQNLARADSFKRMVEAAGQRWPDGWMKGEGFVLPPDVADPMTPPPGFDRIGEEYVRQIVDLSPGSGSGTSASCRCWRARRCGVRWCAPIRRAGQTACSLGRPPLGLSRHSPLGPTVDNGSTGQ